MGEPVELTLPDPAATEALGASLARALPARGGFVVLLTGEIGAGKTTLVRGLLRAAGHAGPVPSPTYTLVEPYESGGRHYYHLDLYRIAEPEELEYLGWRDMEEAVTLVEWAERAPALAARADLVVNLAHARAGRTVRIEAVSDRGAAVAALIRQSISDLN